MIKFSKTAKMRVTGEKVLSYSIPAGGKYCPAAKDSAVCDGCYAQKGRYRFSNVQKPRLINYDDHQKDDWVGRMVAALRKEKVTYLRLHDSGDLYSKAYAEKWLEVLTQVPDIRVWIPTRMTKIRSMRPTLHALQALPNVQVRHSNDDLGITKSRADVDTFVINRSEVQAAQQKGIHICPVGFEEGRRACNECTACYSAGDVAYLIH
ncbi:MAG: hypothetical protein U9Q38_06380 [Thermodesulfobacteriota bacterium]|nr:hypothetical protein [Thermodesulfobacteriota bacterium]